MINSLEKKNGELTIELGKLNNKQVYFVHLANKWKEIEFKFVYYICCSNNCINTNKPYGFCIEGNGFINLIDNENIKYINCVEGKGKL
uniref:Uncharacterized protein n=1 Tax=Meloidogyne hapla TaxID=6305 RepID=A0A1I8BI81_MELHA